MFSSSHMWRQFQDPIILFNEKKKLNQRERYLELQAMAMAVISLLMLFFSFSISSKSFSYQNFQLLVSSMCLVLRFKSRIAFRMWKKKKITVKISINFWKFYSGGEISGEVGVNYGQLGNNLPAPRISVRLIQSLKAKRVKIYDANAEILEALRNTGIQVSIMLPNQLVVNASTNQTFSDQWVRSNVVPFYPQTLIRYLLVGNELISSTGALEPAFYRFHVWNNRVIIFQSLN